MMHPTLIFWSNTVSILLLLISFFIILRTRKYTKESLALGVNAVIFGLSLFWIVLIINELNYLDKYFGSYIDAYASWLSIILPILTGNVILIILTLVAICLLIGGLILRNNLTE